MSPRPGPVDACAPAAARAAAAAAVLAAVLAAAALTGCGASTGTAPARTATTSAPATASGSAAVSASAASPTAAVLGLRAAWVAFFAGCENGTLPPPGIQVSCDPTDGSDTAPAAAEQFCARVAVLAPALARGGTGSATGSMNVGLSPASGVVFGGAQGRLLRCSYPDGGRVDVASAPAGHSGAFPSAAVAGLGADRCEGRAGPTLEVACLDPAGWGIALAGPAALPGASLTVEVAALAADLGAPAG